MAIEHIIFDLSEVFIRGLKDFERDLCPKEKICPVNFKKHLQGIKLYHLFEGKMSEDEYWIKVREEGKYKIPAHVFKTEIRSFFTALPDGGAVESLRKLDERSIPLTLLSDHTLEWIQEIEQQHHFLSLFNERCYSFQSGYTKESVHAFDYTLNRADADPEQTLFIDDNPHNIQTARRAGITYVHQYTNPAKLETFLRSHKLIA